MHLALNTKQKEEKRKGEHLLNWPCLFLFFVELDNEANSNTHKPINYIILFEIIIIIISSLSSYSEQKKKHQQQQHTVYKHFS